MSSKTANKYFQGKENVAGRDRAAPDQDPAATSRRRSSLIPITKGGTRSTATWVETQYAHLKI